MFSSIKVISLLESAADESLLLLLLLLFGRRLEFWPEQFPGFEFVSLKLNWGWSSPKSRMLGVERGRSFGVGGHSWNGEKEMMTQHLFVQLWKVIFFVLVFWKNWRTDEFGNVFKNDKRWFCFLVKEHLRFQSYYTNFWIF